MSERRSGFECLVVLVLFLSGFILGCGGKESGEPVPFENGDYFEYEAHGGPISDIKHSDIYEISKKDGNTYECATTTVFYEVRDRLLDEREDLKFELDKFGQIVRAFSKGEPIQDNFGLYFGHHIRLWLPPSMRKAGGEILFSGCAKRFKITERKEWESWTVWPAEVDFGDEKIISYYDAETGFLVGQIQYMFTGDRGFRLVDTNKDILH